MPNFLKLNGFRFFIYSNEHFPEHIHVHGKGGKAIFMLNCKNGEISLHSNNGYNFNQIKDAWAIMNDNQAIFCKFWEMLHGKP